MKSDRELLELAAKAAGVEFDGLFDEADQMSIAGGGFWNPLTDDGDALRLAVKLGIDIEFQSQKVVFADGNFSEFLSEDPNADSRRAIVRAAAAIGEAMP